MIEHLHYEEFCALLAIGEISEAELQDLRFHLADCKDCRDRIADFSQLSAQVIPIAGDRYIRVTVPAGMSQRFHESARRAGFPMRDSLFESIKSSWFRPRMLAAVCCSFLLLIVAVFGADHAMLRRRQGAVAGPVAPPAPPAASAPLLPLHEPLLTSKQESILATPRDDERRGEFAIAQMQQLRDEIAELKRDNTDISAKRDRLTANMTELSAAMSKAQEDATEQAAAVVQLKQQLDKRQGMDAADIVTLADREDKIKGLQQQIAQRDSELAHARSLLAVSDQAKDLIVARNLHIIDVHDSNGLGTHQLPFGRIFYTEGKSLIFYAYDLQRPGDAHDASLAFHVWGSRLGDDASVKSLGIFRSENANDARWVLTCDDPHVFAQVNTVFVTTETKQKNGEGPRGKRILYAFLGDRPNHP